MVSASVSDTSASVVGTRAIVLEVAGGALLRVGRAEPILDEVRLELRSGECVLLQGATGSGKSTLLRALARLPGARFATGRPRCSERVTVLLQHVETQLLCTTVGEEVGLGLRTEPTSPPRVERLVRDALARVGLSGMEGREVDRLSAGEKQRVVLAALLALDPRVLLLDEPSAALDPAARRALARVLGELKAQGTAVLLADHAPAELSAIVDRRVTLEAGRLRVASGPPGVRDTSLPRAPRSGDRPGARTLVTGPNGSGKSSWLRALAGRERRRPGDVALVIQEPRRGLFARTVREEVEFGLVRGGVVEGERRARVRELLERFDLGSCAERSPRRLSFGQQHRLAIAAALAPRPSLVLLDEPFAGLDPAARSGVLTLLEDEQARSGGEIVVASHDREPLASWCGRVVELSAGEASDA